MNNTPRSKSQNDFCSFRREIWLLTQCFKLLSFFTARRSYASAVLGVVILSVCPSGRLSVRPSVCLSHACCVTNPKNLPATFYTTWKINPSSFLVLKISAKFQRGHPQRGHQIEVG